MAEIKKINTELQPIDKLLDTSGDAGTSGQILSTTGSGTNWIDNTGGGGTVTGTGADEQVTYWTGSSVIDGDSGFKYNKSASNIAVVTIDSITSPQLGFVETNSAYTDAMRIVRGSDKLHLTYGHNANEEAITILGGTGSDVGYVGIKETAPEVQLEVAGDIWAKDSYISCGLGATDGYQFHDFGSGWGLRGMSGGVGSRISIYTDGTERFYIDTNGDATFLKDLTINNGDAYNQLLITNSTAADTNKQSGIMTKNYAGNNTSIFQTYCTASNNTIYYGSADGNYRGLTQHIFYVNAGVDATTSHTETLRLKSDLSATFAGNITFSSGSDIIFPDNLGAALEFKEGSNLYMRFVTTNGSEEIQMEKATTISNTLNVSGNITGVTETLTGTESLMLVLNPTANNYGGIWFKYDGTSKGMSVYNSGSMIYGGESGVGTKLQTNGQTALTIDTSQNSTFAGIISAPSYLRLTNAINQATLPDVPDEHVITLNPPTTTNYYGGGISWSEGSNTAASIGVYDEGSGGALGMYFATGNNTTLTKALTLDDSGNATLAGNLTMSGAQILTTSGQNLALNPNTGLVTIGGTLQASGTGVSYFSGDLQAKRDRSNTAGDVALSVNPDDSTIHYGFRIDQTTNSFNLDRVDSAGELLRVDTSGNVTVTGDINMTDGELLKWSGNSILNHTGTSTLIGDNSSSAVVTISGGNTTFTGLVTGIAPSTDLNFATKKYVDDSISGTATYKTTWDARTAAEGGSGAGGNPDLTSNYKTNGWYLIVSNAGSATPNGPGTTPDSWHVGDWVIFNEDLGSSGEWQKIDNSSVISGAGTGQKVVKWDGSGTSETLADGPITFSTNDSTFAGNIVLDDGSGNSPYVQFINADNDEWYIQNNSSSKLRFVQNGTERGLWSSGELELTNGLIVGGNATFAGTIETTNGILKLTNSSNTRQISCDGAGNLDISNAANNASIFQLQDGALTLGTTIGTGTLSLYAGDATFTGDIQAPGIYVGSTNTGYDFYNNGTSYFNGAVTVDAAFTQTGGGASSFSGDLTVANLYAGQYIYHTGNVNTYINFQTDRQTYVAGNVEFIDFNNTTQDYITVGNSTDVDTKLIGGTGYIFIQGSDGYIGINDITPTSPLDINANTAISGRLAIGTTPHATFKLDVLSTAADWAARIKNSTTDGYGLAVDCGGMASTTTYALAVYGGAGTGDFFVRNDGKVAIGTSSPDAKLSVTSTTTNSEDIVYLKSGADNADEYLGLAFEIGGGGNGPHGAVRVYNGPSGSDAYMSLLTTTDGGTLTQGLTQDHLGNIGIGVVAPSSRLELLSSTDYKYVRFRADNNEERFKFYVGASGNSSALTMYDASEVAMIVLSTGGESGIGTSSPSAKLEVSSGGTINAHGDTDLFVQHSSAASTTAQIQIAAGNTGYSNIYLSDTDSHSVGGFIYNHTNNSLTTRVVDQDRMHISGARNSSYVADGIWGATATPCWITESNGGAKFLLGYQDNGSGLYAAAYGFETKSTDGLGNTVEEPAIILKNTNSNSYVFQVSNLGTGDFASEITAGDDINTPTKLVVGESATAEVRIKKTDAGYGKLSWYNNDGSSSTQTAYISHDSNEDLVYYLPANKQHEFYGSGSERLLIGGDVTVSGSTDLVIAGASRRISFTSGSGTIKTTTGNSLILQTDSSDGIVIDGSTQKVTMANNVGIGDSPDEAGFGLEIHKDGSSDSIGILIHNKGTNAADDAKISFETQGQRDISIGIDRSDGFFKISHSGDLGTNDWQTFDASGNVTFAGNVAVDGGRITITESGTQNELLIMNASSDVYADQVWADTGGSIRLRSHNGAFKIYTGGDANSLSANNSTQGFSLSTSQNATFAGDITVSGGDITTNGFKTISNSSSAAALEIGDVDGGSDITRINFKASGGSSLEINGDGMLMAADHSITLNGDSHIILDSSLTTSKTSGTIIKIGDQTVAAGEVYIRGAGGGGGAWDRTSAGTESLSGTGLLAYSLGTNAQDDGMLLNGVIYDASHGFTVGLPIYIGVSTGTLTTTAPSGSGEVVRIVGYALDANHIYFCPDTTWVKID